MTDHTLPPEVEEALEWLDWPPDRTTEGMTQRVRTYLTTQAEELHASNVALQCDTNEGSEKVCTALLTARAERDHYKAMAEWLANRLVRERPDTEGAVWLKAAEEATSTPCPLCAGTGKEHDNDSWQQTPCVCQEPR